VAGNYDMAVRAGATFRLRLAVQRAGEPVDLTGWQARWQVRPDRANQQVLLDATSAADDGVVTVDQPEQGGLSLHLDAAATTALTWRSGVYGLSLTTPAGDVQQLLEGNITVQPGVPR
jgi:hypothetical protein